MRAAERMAFSISAGAAGRLRDLARSALTSSVELRPAAPARSTIFRRTAMPGRGKRMTRFIRRTTAGPRRERSLVIQIVGTRVCLDQPVHEHFGALAGRSVVLVHASE